MLLTREHRSYQLSTPVQYIRQVWPTFDNSIALQTTDNKSCPIFLHFDSEGNLSYYYTTKDHRDIICLIDDRNIAVTEKKLERITLINLQSKSVRHIPHKYLPRYRHLIMNYFPDSNLVYVSEKYIQKQVQKLTFFSLENIQQQVGHIYIQHSRFVNSYMQSMITTVEYTGDHQIAIMIYDLKEIIKGHRQPKVVTIESNLIEEGSYQIREFGENKFLLQLKNTRTQRDMHKNFIVDIQQKTVRDPNFAIGNKELTFTINFGDFSVFFVDQEKLVSNRHLMFRIYYVICHQSESVIDQINLDKSVWYYQRGNRRNSLFVIDSMKCSNQKIELEVEKFEAFEARDLQLFLLLGIYEDFDDDLLFDVVDLLTN